MTLIVGICAALAFASTYLLAIFVVLSASHVIIEIPAMRQARMRHAARKQRRLRREKREARLHEAFIATGELSQLGQIVDGVLERSQRDPLELEALLDRYADLAVMHERYVVAMRRTDRARLEARLADATSRAAGSCLPNLLTRRIAHAQILARAVDQTRDQLEMVGEVIRYCGERASMPELGSALDTNLVVTSLERCDALESLELELSQGANDDGIQQ